MFRVSLTGVAVFMVIASMTACTVHAQDVEPSPQEDLVATLFGEFPELDEVLWFDNQTKGWQIYIRAIHPRTLVNLHPGEPSVFVVNKSVVVRGHQLSCLDEFCLRSNFLDMKPYQIDYSRTIK